MWIPLSNRKWGWELLREQLLPSGEGIVCSNCSCSLFCTKQISVRSPWFIWTIQQEKLGGSLLQFIRIRFGPSLPWFAKTWQLLLPRNQGVAQSYKLFCVGKQKGRLDAHSTFQHSLFFAAWPWVGIRMCHLSVLAGDPPVSYGCYLQ